jgi:hypothetical protein
MSNSESRQYVYCVDRKGNPHIPIEVCRTKCEKYPSCRAGGLDEAVIEEPKVKATKAKRATKPSALSRILGDDS